MSWLMAVNRSPFQQGKEDSFYHGNPLYKISLPGLYLALGGNPDTCFFNQDIKTQSGWAVVGTGIRLTGGKAAILTKLDWANLLTQQTFSAADLDGHFAAVRWKESCVECFTDQLGLRSVYFAKGDHGICLSTRLDWVARNTGKTELDFNTLGSRWLLLNQISYDSCIIGIERLGPGGQAHLQEGTVLKFTIKPWLPSFEPSTPFTALEILRTFVKSALEYKYTTSLGLSGGLDSRLLLVFLTSFSDHKFETHTFGDPEDPDVVMAIRIAAKMNLTHFNFNDPLPDVQICVSDIRSLAAQTNLSETVTSYYNIRHYQKLYAANRILIDGAYGEIGRRLLMNRVVRLGRSAIRSQNIPTLFRLMRCRRADIFSGETMKRLSAGAYSNLQKMFEERPAVKKIGIENFADLVTIQTRLPNSTGPEQARLDGEVINFMPFVQPSFLQAIFGIPPHLRANSKIYYHFIRRSNPALTRFPLVKNGISYPFGLSRNAAWLLTRVKSKLSGGYADPGLHRFLFHIREYVLDEVHSGSVKNNSIYDYRKIVDSVTKYYQGSLDLRNIVDWWLTFELWRRSLSPDDD